MPFSEQTLQFLFEVRMRDDRSWFRQNHDLYDAHVIAPTRALIDSLAPSLLELDDQLIIEGRVGRCISRINRDTRFTKNKELYRDVVWISFVREKHASLPELFFEYSPRGLRWGCGWYCPPRETVDTLREMVLAGSELWHRADETLLACPHYALVGDRYKRTRYPGQDERRRLWLDCKDLCIMGCEDGPERLFSPRLAPWLAEQFHLLKPAYELFLQARVLSEGRKSHV